MAKLHFSLPLVSLDPVVIDTETTGLDVRLARIVQLGAVKIRDRHISQDAILDILINPEEPIPAATTVIHGITDQMVSDRNRFGDIADSFVDFLGDAVLLGHNIGFDIAILKREFSLSGKNWSVPPILDTMMLARIVNPVLPNFSLEVIADWLNVEVKNRHSALGDATTTAEIYLALLPLLRKAGIRTIADAQRASIALSQNLSEQATYTTNGEPAGITGEVNEFTSIQRIDSFPFEHRVQDVMSSPALIVGPTTTPAQLATLLAEQNKSAAFVSLPAPDSPLGIVTERDLMRLLANPEYHRAMTVETMASSPLVTVSKDAFVYQALGLMHAASIRHLGVEDDAGVLIGALTSGDLMRQRAHEAVTMSGDWENSSTVGSLATTWGRLPLIAKSLMDEGIDARLIADVLGEQLAAITRRAAELAEADMADSSKGKPPAPYCVLLLGSGGRGETLLAPDQDNAIVYANGVDHAGGWFAEFGKIMCQILDEAGVPYCKGGVMASNSEWRQDLQSWKKTIHGWLSRAEWKDLCYVDIFFDFRPVHGDQALASDLWNYAYDLAGKAPGFVRQLSALATSFGAPLGVFGGLKTKYGRIDLKGSGTLPLVSGARVLALHHGIRAHSTEQRLAGVKRLNAVNADDVDDIFSAHEYLLRCILKQQLLDLAGGITPSNSVDIRQFAKRERAKLKHALKAVAIMHTAVGDPMAFG